MLPGQECIQDCNGDWGGDAVVDECEICGGDNTECADCEGTPNGSAYYDECNVCDDNPSNDCVQDCNGDWGGSALIDECSFCSGGNTGLEYNEYFGCDGECFSGAELDNCGVCDGDGTSCEILGDLSGDGIIDVIDIVSLVNLILGGGEYNHLADLNEDGMVDVIDIVMMINWILYGMPVYGCMDDEDACNYNPSATDIVGCTYVDGICETCENGMIIDNDIDDDGICDGDEIEGCTYEDACNYNPNATSDNGSCTYVDGICETCESGEIIDNDLDDDGVCDE